MQLNLQDAATVESDFMAMHHLLKEDALRMYQVMKRLNEVKTSSLIPPNNLPSNQAKGYAEGSKDAFQRVGHMAEYVISNLTYDFERLLSDEQEKASTSNASGVE